MVFQLFTILPMFVCALMSAELALVLRRQDDAARRWLLAWAVTATLLYVCHYLFFNRAMAWIPLSDAIYTTCNLAVYPLYLIYICRLTATRTPRVLYALLALAVVAGAAAGTLYALMSPDETQRFVCGFLYGRAQDPIAGLVAAQVALHWLCRLLFAAGVVCVGVVGTRRIRIYNRQVEQLYADTEGRSLHTIRTLLLLLVAMSLLSLLANAIGRAHFAGATWPIGIVSLLFSALLFAIGWAGLWQQTCAAELHEERTPQDGHQPADRPEASPTATGRETVGNLRQQLEQLMLCERLYLEADLKLDDLARRMGTNRTYLLRMLNDDLHMSFSEYINRQRIAYACQLMQQQPELTKNDVAFRSGYASLSSFYRNLKLYAP